jgi:hypothetical protein
MASSLTQNRQGKKYADADSVSCGNQRSRGNDAEPSPLPTVVGQAKPMIRRRRRKQLAFTDSQRIKGDTIFFI